MKIQDWQLNNSIRGIKLPDYMRELPVSRQGFPVPYFVASIDGDWDFRVIAPGRREECLNRRLCWVCGKQLGTIFSFVAGPMCVVTTTTAEPPCHHACAIYAATTCPFLAQPAMKRNEKNMTPEKKDAPGIAIDRNPGVAAVLMTRKWKTFPVGDSYLIEMGEPLAIDWFARRRRATLEEVLESIRTGMPLLMDAAEQEGPEAIKELHAHLDRAQRWLPRDLGRQHPVDTDARA